MPGAGRGAQAAEAECAPGLREGGLPRPEAPSGGRAGGPGRSRWLFPDLPGLRPHALASGFVPRLPQSQPPFLPLGVSGTGCPELQEALPQGQDTGLCPGPMCTESVPAWAELQGLWGQAQRATPPVVLLTYLVLGPWSWPPVPVPPGSSVLAPCLCLQASLSLTDHFSALPGVSGIHSNSERCLHPARVSSEGRTGGQDTLTLLPLSIWSVFFLHGNHQGPSDPAPACPTL